LLENNLVSHCGCDQIPDLAPFSASASQRSIWNPSHHASWSATRTPTVAMMQLTGPFGLRVSRPAMPAGASPG
jgi:hypothetical protein